jgi:hypothetical protein
MAAGLAVVLARLDDAITLFRLLLTGHGRAGGSQRTQGKQTRNRCTDHCFAVFH